MKKLPVLFPTRSEKSSAVAVGTPDASKLGMKSIEYNKHPGLNITNSVGPLWRVYRSLTDAEKEIVARGIVARLFGAFEAIPSEPGAELFRSVVEGELNTAQSRAGGAL